MHGFAMTAREGLSNLLVECITNTGISPDGMGWLTETDMRQIYLLINSGLIKVAW
jgi:hypothetical protein